MFNDIQNNNMYFGQTADNFNASSNCPNPYQGFDPNSRRYGYGDVNRCLSQSEANYVSTSIPTYPLENPDSRRHDKGNGKGDEIIHKRSYYNNDGIHCCLIEESSNGKAKITPLAFAFSIGCVTYIREYGETPIKYVLIAGGTERPYSSIITYEDYMNERFYQNMKWIRRCPGCTKKQINDLIYDQIQKAPKSEAKIYSRQGFVKVGDNDYSFGSYPEDMKAYAEIMSDSVKMKKLIPIYREAQEIVDSEFASWSLDKCTEYCLEINKVKMSPTTYNDYHCALNKHIKPYFKNGKPLKDIRAKDIESFCSTLIDSGKSPKTVHKMLSLIGPAFRYAEKNDFILKNPMRVVDKPSKVKK